MEGMGWGVSWEACTIRAHGSVPVLSWLHCPTRRHSFTGTIVCVPRHLGFSLLRARVPTGLGGQVGSSTGLSVQVIPPVLHPCVQVLSPPLVPKPCWGLALLWAVLPGACEVSRVTSSFPSLERQRQRCLPGLVSFVKAPAAGMSQDLLSPSERGGEKGSVSSAPGPGCVGSSVHLCCHRLSGRAGSKTSREGGRFWLLCGLERLGEGDGVMEHCWPSRDRSNLPVAPLLRLAKYLTNAELGPEI